MAGNVGTPPIGEQQQAPVVDGSRYDKLEERVRKIEDTINRVSGVMSVIRWIVPPLLIVGGGMLIFILGQSSS